MNPKAAPTSPRKSEPAPKKRRPLPKRKRCRNCKTLFPLTKLNRLFCKEECRIIFNRFGPGYQAIFKKLTAHYGRTIREAVNERTLKLRLEFAKSDELTTSALIHFEKRIRTIETQIAKLDPEQLRRERIEAARQLLAQEDERMQTAVAISQLSAPAR